MRTALHRRDYLSLILLLLASLVMLVPFLWVLCSSFKAYRETVQLPISFLPQSFSNLSNYGELLVRYNFLTYYRNNLIVTVGILLPQLILSSMAAYAFARIDFPLREPIFISLLVALMVPIQMILMPRYSLMLKLGWFDTFWAVIIPSVPSVTTTFFIRQQMLSIPTSLDESARIDGAGHWRICWRILMPLCKGSILAMGVMCVVFAWNDFLWPLIVLNKQDKYVLSIAVANLQGQNLTRDNLLLTAAVLVSLPIVALFLLLQRYFVEGVATTGLKE